ncbi:FecR family protein [Chryseolinea lacunae]|uniref:FecR domain-containing protein n=1 Tax=Chryseolinea lacunae TaxID=2801331 RepID=A0ABS1KKK8_9BACT|nr:FecR domain-containing protein [Chryseolinea lacunae]MBL0739995.1 FecR domain-containing protein [Chryseolinea lacunae]
MMNLDEDQFRRLLDAYLEGRATPAEKKLLDDFFESYPAARMHAMDDDEHVKLALWKKLAARTAPAPQKQPVVLWYSIAASVALLVVAAYFVVYKKNNDDADVPAVHQQMAETVRGQKLKIELVDGTQVILNANSKLTFPEQFPGNTREVYLEGEAYFDVAHNQAQPFIVHSPASNTTVLGTSFNVKAAGDETEITLVEGKVDVAHADNNNAPHTILAPHQQAVIREGSAIVTRRVDVSEFVDWKDNILHFKNTTLKQTAARLEQWYNVDIVFENADLEKCVVNATYEKESLKNILVSLGYMFKMQYEQHGRTVKFSGEGCP